MCFQAVLGEQQKVRVHMMAYGCGFWLILDEKYMLPGAGKVV